MHIFFDVSVQTTSTNDKTHTTAKSNQTTKDEISCNLFLFLVFVFFFSSLNKTTGKVIRWGKRQRYSAVAMPEMLAKLANQECDPRVSRDKLYEKKQRQLIRKWI